jgi:hypothetical protein
VRQKKLLAIKKDGNEISFSARLSFRETGIRSALDSIKFGCVGCPHSSKGRIQRKKNAPAPPKTKTFVRPLPFRTNDDDDDDWKNETNNAPLSEKKYEYEDTKNISSRLRERSANNFFFP